MAKAKDVQIDVALIKATFFYCSDTGIIRWAIGRPKASVGNVAGSADSRGYINVMMDGHRLLGHRIAWAIYYGRWPAHQIDHINRDPSDNRICNLREATDSQNKANSIRMSGTTYSRLKGACWDKKKKKWFACIRLPSGRKYLGYFDREEEAHAAYAAAALAKSGEFARVS